MSERITIDLAHEADIPSIRSLLMELMDAMTDTGGFSIDQSVENCRSLIRDPGQYVLVARQGESVVGFMNFSTRKTVIHPGPSALIDELVVSKSTRGTGIGRQLIEMGIRKSRELGCCEVEVSMEKSNSRARRFYRTCGFEEDAVLLEFDLDDSPPCVEGWPE